LVTEQFENGLWGFTSDHFGLKVSFSRRIFFLSFANTHLICIKPVKQKRYFIKEVFKTSLFFLAQTDNPTNAVFSFRFGCSLHCAKHPSGSRPHTEITP
jgi:hypothetical protein